MEVRTRLRGLSCVCGGGLFSLEVESRLRGLQLCVVGGVCMKKSIVRREERLCVSEGGGGVYEKINSEMEK